MAKIADISSKQLVGLAPEQWVRWATGLAEVAGCSMISGEFQALARATDALVKVDYSTAGPFLALFEVQLYYKTAMPLRMAAYAALGEQTYGLPVYPVLINILPYSKPIPMRHERTFLGLSTRRDYRVINLWETSAEEVLAQSLTSLLPLTPVMQGGNTEEMLLRAQSQLANAVELQDSDRLEEALTALTIFATFVFDLGLVQRHLGGNMEALTGTPFYQEVQHRNTRAILSRILTRRLGALTTELEERLEALPVGSTENLIDAIADTQINSLHDLEAWLDDQEIVH